MRAPKLGFLALSLCLIPAAMVAQQVKTPVTFVVADPSGAAISQAKISLIPAPDSSLAAETGPQGKLRIDLLPGHYGMVVTGAGFKRSESRIEIQSANQGQTITVTLQPGTGSGPAVYTLDPNTLLLRVLPSHDDVKLTTSDLKNLPHVSITIHNPHANADETYSGVRLADLLAKYDAPLGLALHGEALSIYVVAIGSDGYKAVFSLAEIDPSFHPGEVLVADTMNGTPLDAKTGPFRLVVTEDKRPARSVRNLIAIELKSAD
jgi:hypothetical protein